jgi:hypothetical protein
MRSFLQWCLCARLRVTVPRHPSAQVREKPPVTPSPACSKPGRCRRRGRGCALHGRCREGLLHSHGTQLQVSQRKAIAEILSHARAEGSHCLQLHERWRIRYMRIYISPPTAYSYFCCAYHTVSLGNASGSSAQTPVASSLAASAC